MLGAEQELIAPLSFFCDFQIVTPRCLCCRGVTFSAG
jgi:hypothetical protein